MYLENKSKRTVMTKTLSIMLSTFLQYLYT